MKFTVKHKSIAKWSLYFVVVGGIFFGGGYYIGAHKTMSKELDRYPIREKSEHYEFISPLLGYHVPPATAQLKDLKDKINEYINKNKSENDGISVYYRDFTTDNWLGINEDTKYSPASMLKVIIMIGYLKKAESNPNLLSNNLTYTSDFKKVLDDIPYDSQTELRVGSHYHVSDLINKMIIDSDNGAKDLLLSNIEDDFLNSVYTDLGLSGPDSNSEYLISPRAYSFFFRVLYNATYLNREMSEKALDILSKAVYANGLRAGIPNDIKIAHKFGEHVESEEGKDIKYIELHDCGIVYPEGKSYAVCIMTHGTSIPELEGYIQNISKIIYTQVESN